MAKKELGKDKFGIQKVMRRGDYLGDSLGQFALNAIGGLVGQLTYFYTDKVGVAAGAVATAFLVVRILDAFTDMIMGYIVDHTTIKGERYRPWLLYMVVPTALLIAMLFTVPASVSSTVQILYMFVTNFLLSAVIYTVICVPYQALIVVRTASQEERSRMGTWRAAAGYISGMVIVVAIIPITNMLGGDQRAWIIFGSVMGIISALLLFITWRTSKETNPAAAVESQESLEEPVPMGIALKNLFGNKYWVLALIMGICSNVTYGLGNSSGTYYAKWIYGDDNLMGIMGAVGLIPTVLGFALVGVLIKRLGVTKTLQFSFTLGAASQLLRLISPAHFTYNLVLGCVSTFSNIPMMCVLGVVTAMSIDYNELLYDKRMVATSQSAASFAGKIGQGLGTSMIGWCLAIASYNPDATVLTGAVRQAIYTFNIYAPAAMFIIMLICSMKFDLEAKLPGIHEEIAKRKATK